MHPGSSLPPDLRRPLREVVREHIERVLVACDGNKSRASRILEIDTKTLVSRLREPRTRADA